MTTLVQRKGARSRQDIPPNVLEQLNCGEIETANLVEWLAVDQTMLLQTFLKKSHRLNYLKPTLQALENLQKKTVNTINQTIGESLYAQSALHSDKTLVSDMRCDPADMVRCWAVYATVQQEFKSIRELLERINIFANDTHFGVREISWLAVRAFIAQHLLLSIEVLSEWSHSPFENIRRFASEATRPRGVWCAHITELKQNPALAKSILEPLKADASKYVRDSVGNWLNDAGKSQPDYVIQLCKRWQSEGSKHETDYIVKKALRNI